jgi:hypothetical protein
LELTREIETLRKENAAYENEIAANCPEDQTLTETIGAFRKALETEREKTQTIDKDRLFLAGKLEAAEREIGLLKRDAMD